MMSRYELRAARNEIFRTNTERRRAERAAAAAGEAEREEGAAANAQHQKQPSKELRTLFRKLWNTPAFQQKLQSVRSAHPGLKACDKETCRLEHLNAVAEAPCYLLRQAMGWPDKVPFTSAVGELSTKELAEFVAAYRAYESLQPMHEEEQGRQGAQGRQRASERASTQVPAGMSTTDHLFFLGPSLLVLQRGAMSLLK